MEKKVGREKNLKRDVETKTFDVKNPKREVKLSNIEREKKSWTRKKSRYSHDSLTVGPEGLGSLGILGRDMREAIRDNSHDSLTVGPRV